MEILNRRFQIYLDASAAGAPGNEKTEAEKQAEKERQARLDEQSRKWAEAAEESARRGIGPEHQKGATDTN